MPSTALMLQTLNSGANDSSLMNKKKLRWIFLAWVSETATNLITQGYFWARLFDLFAAESSHPFEEKQFGLSSPAIIFGVGFAAIFSPGASINHYLLNVVVQISLNHSRQANEEEFMTEDSPLLSEQNHSLLLQCSKHKPGKIYLNIGDALTHIVNYMAAILLLLQAIFNHLLENQTKLLAFYISFLGIIPAIAEIRTCQKSLVASPVTSVQKADFWTTITSIVEFILTTFVSIFWCGQIIEDLSGGNFESALVGTSGLSIPGWVFGGLFGIWAGAGSAVCHKNLNTTLGQGGRHDSYDTLDVPREPQSLSWQEEAALIGDFFGHLQEAGAALYFVAVLAGVEGWWRIAPSVISIILAIPSAKVNQDTCREQFEERARCSL